MPSAAQRSSTTRPIPHPYPVVGEEDQVIVRTTVGRVIPDLIHRLHTDVRFERWWFWIIRTRAGAPSSDRTSLFVMPTRTC